jgi:hypothetical protein
MVICEQLKDAPTGCGRGKPAGMDVIGLLAILLRCGAVIAGNPARYFPTWTFPESEISSRASDAGAVPAVRERFALSLSTAGEIADAKEELETARCL